MLKATRVVHHVLPIEDGRSFDKLNNSNWGQWRMFIKAVLVKKNVWEVQAKSCQTWDILKLNCLDLGHEQAVAATMDDRFVF
jgi:hypothetical protein